jgi:hypothetical protein
VVSDTLAEGLGARPLAARTAAALSLAATQATREAEEVHSDAKVANIVTFRVGGTQRRKSGEYRDVSGGRSLAGPSRDARRFPSTRWYPAPGATRTALGFGICPSFKGHSLSSRARR